MKPQLYHLFLIDSPVQQLIRIDSIWSQLKYLTNRMKSTRKISIH